MKYSKDNPMKKVTLNCSICKEKIDEQITKNTNIVYWTEGHNAEPINDGRCCDVCNDTIVIVKRMEIMGMEDEEGIMQAYDEYLEMKHEDK